MFKMLKLLKQTLWSRSTPPFTILKWLFYFVYPNKDWITYLQLIKKNLIFFQLNPVHFVKKHTLIHSFISPFQAECFILKRKTSRNAIFIFFKDNANIYYTGNYPPNWHWESFLFYFFEQDIEKVCDSVDWDFSKLH